MRLRLAYLVHEKVVEQLDQIEAPPLGKRIRMRRILMTLALMLVLRVSFAFSARRPSFYRPLMAFRKASIALVFENQE